MKKEYQLILELCKFVNPRKQKLEYLLSLPIDYPYVLGQLLYNRMGSTAYYVLRENELLGKVNREFRNTLKSIYLADRERTNSFHSTLNMLQSILQAADFPYALLKGAYLSTLYPKGLRTSNDIDLLIEAKNVSALSELLKNNGFKQGYVRGEELIKASRAEIVSSRINRGETVPFVKKIGLPQMEFCEIDINFSVDHKAAQEKDTVARLLEQRQPLINHTLPTLSPVDFIIHLCLHLFKEATVYAWVDMGRDLSIYKFCDIYLLINTICDKDFFLTAQRRIAALGLEKECYYAFIHTKKLFGIENKAFDLLLNNIKPSRLDYLREIIDPSQNKIYRYAYDFPHFLFCANRKELLYEYNYEPEPVSR